jgi:hypothetical protein
MLQEKFCLPWTDERVQSTFVGVERTIFLASSTAAPTVYDWAVSALLSHLQMYAEKHFKCHKKRSSNSHKISANVLTELSLLAGFTTAYLWTAELTCTIRMAEALAKIWASSFTVGEIFFGSLPRSTSMVKIRSL